MSFDDLCPPQQTSQQASQQGSQKDGLPTLSTGAEVNAPQSSQQALATAFIRAARLIDPDANTPAKAKAIEVQTLIMADLIAQGLAHDRPLAVEGETRKPLELTASLLAPLAFFPEAVYFSGLGRSSDQDRQSCSDREVRMECQTQAHEGLRRIVSNCLMADTTNAKLRQLDKSDKSDKFLQAPLPGMGHQAAPLKNGCSMVKPC